MRKPIDRDNPSEALKEFALELSRFLRAKRASDIIKMSNPTSIAGLIKAQWNAKIKINTESLSAAIFWRRKQGDPIASVPGIFWALKPDEYYPTLHWLKAIAARHHETIRNVERGIAALEAEPSLFNQRGDLFDEDSYRAAQVDEHDLGLPDINVREPGGS